MDAGLGAWLKISSYVRPLQGRVPETQGSRKCLSRAISGFVARHAQFAWRATGSRPSVGWGPSFHAQTGGVSRPEMDAALGAWLKISSYVRPLQGRVPETQGSRTCLSRAISGFVARHAHFAWRAAGSRPSVGWRPSFHAQIGGISRPEMDAWLGAWLRSSSYVRPLQGRVPEPEGSRQCISRAISGFVARHAHFAWRAAGSRPSVGWGPSFHA